MASVRDEVSFPVLLIMNNQSIQFISLLNKLNGLPPGERSDVLHLLKDFISTTENQTETSRPYVLRIRSPIDTTPPCDGAPSPDFINVSGDDLIHQLGLEGNCWANGESQDSGPVTLDYIIQQQMKYNNVTAKVEPIIRPAPDSENPCTVRGTDPSQLPTSSPPASSSSVISKLADPSLPVAGVESVPRSPVLHCPFCMRKLTDWPMLQAHLFDAHPSTLAPVCWHCQGVFDNHAIMMAHECFDWGRLNLPCQALLSRPSSVGATQRALLRESIDLGCPAEGIFFRRRCGLCFRSDTVYNSFKSFQLHKDSTHPVDKLNPSLSFLLDNCSRRNQKPTECPNTPNEACNDGVDHKQPSVIQQVIDLLSRLRSNGSSVPVDQEVSDPVPLGLPVISSTEPSPTERMMSCLVAHQTRVNPSPSPEVDVNGQNVSTTSTTESNTVFKRPRSRKKLSSTTTRKMKVPPNGSNPYEKAFETKIGCFKCSLCPTSFRLTSRLRAHQLFKHGHVPRELEDSPTKPVVIPPDDPSDGGATIAENTTTPIHENTLLPSSTPPKQSTERRFLPLHRKLAPMFRYPIDLDQAVSQTDTELSSDFPAESVEDNGNKADRLKCPDKANRRSHDRDSSRRRNRKQRREERRQVFTCQTCGQSCQSAYNLQRHENRAHLGVNKLHCGYCDFKTSDQTALDEHLSRHLRLKQFVCELCDVRFIAFREYKDHVAFKHNSDRPFICTTCGYKFKTRGTLSRHARTHNEQTRHACRLCPETFTRPSNLKRHVARIHSNKPRKRRLPLKLLTLTENPIPSARESSDVHPGLSGEPMDESLEDPPLMEDILAVCETAIASSSADPNAPELFQVDSMGTEDEQNLVSLPPSQTCLSNKSQQDYNTITTGFMPPYRLASDLPDGLPEPGNPNDIVHVQSDVQSGCMHSTISTVANCTNFNNTGTPAFSSMFPLELSPSAVVFTSEPSSSSSTSAWPQNCLVATAPASTSSNSLYVLTTTSVPDSVGSSNVTTTEHLHLVPLTISPAKGMSSSSSHQNEVFVDSAFQASPSVAIWRPIDCESHSRLSDGFPPSSFPLQQPTSSGTVDNGVLSSCCSNTHLSLISSFYADGYASGERTISSAPVDIDHGDRVRTDQMVSGDTGCCSPRFPSPPVSVPASPQPSSTVSGFLLLSPVATPDFSLFHDSAASITTAALLGAPSIHEPPSSTMTIHRGDYMTNSVYNPPTSRWIMSHSDFPLSPSVIISDERVGSNGIGSNEYTEAISAPSDSCSNFSVGYLIGQDAMTNAAAVAAGLTCEMLPETEGTNASDQLDEEAMHYFSFQSSVD